MKVLVIGATGGSGRAVVEQLLEAGHEVTAFSRRADRLGIDATRLRACSGDALSRADIENAVPGHDAVVVTLGIAENPVRVRLFGPRHTLLDVRSRGTRHVIEAMRRHGVRRLVVLTSYGVGATRGRLGFVDRMLFELLLKPQMRDTELQNQDVLRSGLDWVLVQPVHLTNGEDDSPPFASTDGATERMQISRKSVARFMAEAVASPTFVGQSVALSGSRSGARPRHFSRELAA